MVDSALNGKVMSLIDKQVLDGRQIGVQVSAYKDGEQIVDMWTGTMGPDDLRPERARNE